MELQTEMNIRHIPCLKCHRDTVSISTPVWAAKQGHHHCLKAQIEAGADVNYYGFKSLPEAARYGHDKCVELLIEAGADVNTTCDGYTALAHAVLTKTKCIDSCMSDSHDREKCVSALLGAGADVNEKSINGETALTIAALCGDEKCVSLLIQSGADVNIKTNTGRGPLMLAAQNGYEKCVEMLIVAGADVNAKTSNGNTSLMHAVKKDQTAIAQQLIEAGADINIANKYGDTALTIVTSRGNEKCVNLLVQSGADVNIKNNLGRGPLVFAACHKSMTGCMEMLVKSGADVNALTIRGNTPLNKAACYGNFDNIYFLLSVGARTNVFNNIGKNALKIHLTECKSLSDEIVLLLYAAGETLCKVTQFETFKTENQENVKILKKLCKATIHNQINLAGRDYWGAPSKCTPVPECIRNESEFSLRHICREAIRNHLIEVDPHKHLFARIPQLGLPTVLNDYLLYGKCLKLAQEDGALDPSNSSESSAEFPSDYVGNVVSTTEPVKSSFEAAEEQDVKSCNSKERAAESPSDFVGNVEPTAEPGESSFEATEHEEKVESYASANYGDSAVQNMNSFENNNSGNSLESSIESNGITAECFDNSNAADEMTKFEGMSEDNCDEYFSCEEDITDMR